MTEFVLFRLYGPLASWGSTAVGERRPTEPHPSRSAILGLVAAALGIKREDHERMSALFDQLAYAVCVINPGILMRDYHTAQVPPARPKQRLFTRQSELADDDLNTILSSRDYRLDAVYTVALWLRSTSNLWSLEDIAAALRTPVFQLYLGRKSCPVSLPLSPQVVACGTLRAGFASARFPCDDMIAPLLKTKSLRFFWEGLDPQLAGMAPDMVLNRRDDPGNRTRWQFFDRKEYQHIASVDKELDYVFQQDTVTA